jgi:hypothetical protein
MHKPTDAERELDKRIASILRGESQPSEPKPNAPTAKSDEPVDDWRKLSPDEFRKRLVRDFGFSPQ